MSILEGVRAANIKAQKPKFIIKSRGNLKENRQQQDYESTNACDQDAVQFIQYMVHKSVRLKELLEKKRIINEQRFYQQHLFGSVCLKTMLKQTLDKMMADRRLGKNLKGMNRSNLTEIENTIWSVVERQANLYNNQLQYSQKRKQLQEDLKQRKSQLLSEIEKISQGRYRKASENNMKEMECFE